MFTADIKNLALEITRGVNRTLVYSFGLWVKPPTPIAPLGPPLMVGFGGVLQPPLFWMQPFIPETVVDWLPPKWQPTDISRWAFFFSMWQNPRLPTAAPNIVYNPIANEADPKTGVLLFDIAGSDTSPLNPGNYYFKMQCSQDLKTLYPLSGGVVALFDNPMLVPGYTLQPSSN